jgi:Winged helix-turn helix
VRRSADHLRRMLRRTKISYKRTRRHLKHKQKPEEVAAKKEELAALEKGGIGSARSVSPRRSRLRTDAADHLQLVAGGRAAERGV